MIYIALPVMARKATNLDVVDWIDGNREAFEIFEISSSKQIFSTGPNNIRLSDILPKEDADENLVYQLDTIHKEIQDYWEDVKERACRSNLPVRVLLK